MKGGPPSALGAACADAAAETIVAALCRAAGEPRIGPWHGQLERILDLVTAAVAAVVEVELLVGEEDLVAAGVVEVELLAGEEDLVAAGVEVELVAGEEDLVAAGVVEAGVVEVELVAAEDIEVELPVVEVELVAGEVGKDLLEAGGASRQRGGRAMTIALKRLSKEELRIGALLYPERTYWRPKNRGDCANVARPCPFVGCKYHLFVDINPGTGSIKLNVPDLEVWEMHQSCALDVAGVGGSTLEEVGELLNLTRERIRQVEVRALVKLHRAAPELGEYLQHDGAGPRPTDDHRVEVERQIRVGERDPSNLP